MKKNGTLPVPNQMNIGSNDSNANNQPTNTMNMNANNPMMSMLNNPMMMQNQGMYSPYGMGGFGNFSGFNPMMMNTGANLNTASSSSSNFQNGQSSNVNPFLNMF